MESASRREEAYLAVNSREYMPTDIHLRTHDGGKPNPRRILVVDDEKGVRDAIAGLLSDLGYDVAVAADGAEALALIQDAAFGLVLTDLNMPGMDGWSLAERIKKESNVPIVLITGSERRSVDQRLGKSSVDSVLFKPFRVDELVTVVLKAFAAIT